MRTVAGVDTIRLRVGRLRQVVPDTLTYCWELVSESTALDGSSLAIEVVPARLRCDACAAEHELGDELAFRCPQCGGTALVVVAGEEFSVASIDVVPAAVPT